MRFAIQNMVWAASAIVLCLATGAVAARDWALPDYRQRARFSVSEEAGYGALVEVPYEVTNAVCPAVALGPDGVRLPVRLIHKGRGETSFLVGVADSRNARYELYYDGPENDSESGANPAFVDELPVALQTFNSSSRATPDTWPRMRYMASRARWTREWMNYPGFGTLAAKAREDGRRRRRGRNRPVVLGKLTTFVECPAESLYRFAVRTDRKSFLLVDGELAAVSGDKEADLVAGRPALLAAGPHQLEVYLPVSSQMTVRVYWGSPGSEGVCELDPIPDSAVISAGSAENLIFEGRDTAMNANFSHRVGRPYRFRGVESVFTPVHFNNRSSGSGAEGSRWLWTFGDGDTSTEESPTHTFRSAHKYTTALEMRGVDGAVTHREWDVDCRRVSPMEVVVDVRPGNLPAVAYEDDVVTPQLVIDGQLPNPGILHLRWVVRQRRGDMRTHQRSVSVRSAKSYAFGEVTVGDVQDITWQAEHQGTAVAEGRIRFLSAPFAALPARVEGDRLYDASGSQLVLVPRKFADSARGAAIPGTGSRWVCLDDTLLPAGASESSVRALREALASVLGASGADITFARLGGPAPETAYTPLYRLSAAAAWQVQADDVLLLSVGRDDMLRHEGPATFERYAAALTDVLCASRGCKVVWLTPPPYQSDPMAVRPFAAAVRRVADARQIAVADVFTAFMGVEDENPSLFLDHGQGLSERGRQLVAVVVARALTGD